MAQPKIIAGLSKLAQNGYLDGSVLLGSLSSNSTLLDTVLATGMYIFIGTTTTPLACSSACAWVLRVYAPDSDNSSSANYSRYIIQEAEKLGTTADGTNSRLIAYREYNGTSWSAWYEGGGGGKVECDTAMSTTSENPVQNKVITKYINPLYDALVFDSNNNLTGINIKDEVTGYRYTITMHDGTLATTSAITSIQITTNPTKMTYTAGEYIDTTGMVVTGTCDDGTSKEITNFTCTNYVTTDNPAFTISANGVSIDLPVTVTAFDPAVVLIDFTYTDNGDGTYTILNWKETYNGEPSTEMIVPNNAYIIL